MVEFVYLCNHPLYDKCTLLKEGDKGIAVIQQRFNEKLKCTWWGPIDASFVNDILTSPYLNEYFEENASNADSNGLYFTVEVRKLLWSLKLKPVKKAYWETRF